MPQLNYAGPNMGPSTVANTLPSGVPGTVPAAVPGAAASNVGSITPTGAIQPSRPAIPQGLLPPMLANSIQPPGASGPGPADQGNQPPEYDTLTQQDGSIVLFLKNPDGTRGPAVKIVPPLRHPGRPSPGGAPR